MDKMKTSLSGAVRTLSDGAEKAGHGLQHAYDGQKSSIMLVCQLHINLIIYSN